MRMTKLVAVCATSAIGVALFDAGAAEARGAHHAASFKIQRAVVVNRQPRVVFKQAVKLNKTIVARNLSTSFAHKTAFKAGKVKLASLPIQTTVLKGRLSVPVNLKPKLTLTHVPNAKFRLRLGPFVQKHWKKTFFWVAIAGIGYVTVPEFYYDRFLAYMNGDDPNYEDCIGLLSSAAFEEQEDVVRVRQPMPPTATYRYEAKLAPTPQDGSSACGMERFVERTWNRSFVWVQVPQTGNVTVPEDYYDRFHGLVAGESPNYPAACQVLVEAAAADMMTTTSLDAKGPELQ
jgi:hypothetical protein